jgi:hypothetical protein
MNFTRLPLPTSLLSWRKDGQRLFQAHMAVAEIPGGPAGSEAPLDGDGLKHRGFGLE